MDKRNGKTVISGTPLSISPAGVFDSYEIKVGAAAHNPFFAGQVIMINLPKGLRLDIAKRTGEDLSGDTICSINEILPAIEVEGYLGTQFTESQPDRAKYSFKSLVRSKDGEPLFVFAVSGVSVLIKEDEPDKPQLPLWLSTKEHMRRWLCRYNEKVAFALSVNSALQDLLDANLYGDAGDADSRYNPDCDKNSDTECDGDCENCSIPGIFGITFVDYDEDEDEDDDL